MKLNDNISSLKGIGDSLTQQYLSLGIITLADLINYYPRKYLDYSNITSIKDLTAGQVSLKATISNLNGRYLRKGLHITEAIASDDSGSVRLIWFNQPYRVKAFQASQQYFISGKFELKYNRFSINNPSTELAKDLPINTARILSVYPETKHLNSAQIRKAIAQIKPVFSQIKEPLPASIIKDYRLVGLSEALVKLHLPNNLDDINLAKKRLGFDEVFLFVLASLLNKQENKNEKSLVINFDEQLAKKFVKSLQFRLTDSQRIAVWQIYKDMSKKIPMSRLVEGDVGSGKTVVALMAALMVINQQKQVAFMAPTEILARQHFKTISELLKPLGLEANLLLLLGSLSAKHKQAVNEQISQSDNKIIIGTHALIQNKLNINKLGLVILDEQHRFGVQQRTDLIAKSAGLMPHVLSLSATPIPRSLALTLYGELSITRLTEKPKGRPAVKTKIIYASQKIAVYKKIEDEIRLGRQAFIVCPAIEDNLISVNSAVKVYDDLRNGQFKHLRLGLIHGKLKTNQKEQVMQDFINQKIDILVATTVIEVGIDVANASVMLILSPERFGLAQLHQLRGRIGRGKQESYFFMLIELDDSPKQRLSALERIDDGFALAELDLKLRGPGAIYGKDQHGLLDLRIADLSNKDLIYKASTAAKQLMSSQPDIKDYPELYQKVNNLRAITNLN